MTFGLWSYNPPVGRQPRVEVSERQVLRSVKKVGVQLNVATSLRHGDPDVVWARRCVVPKYMSTRFSPVLGA